MKNILAVTLLLSSSLSIACARHIEGTYNCHGNDPFLKKDYAGTVTIKKAGQAFNVTMNFDKGDRLQGTGILNKKGKAIAIITKDMRDVKNPDYGITYFNIKDHGKKLIGQWTNLGSTQVVDEVCERQK